jgi:signal transduction histidine kinase
MRQLACLVLFFCFAPLVKAQLLPLETYTPASGMVDARVSKMFQDSNGRLYFLTREGFSIFDGQRFDNYGAEIGYGTGIISDIAEYSNGIVKIYSYDGDVYILNHNKMQKDTTQRKYLREFSKIFNISNDDKLIVTNYHILRQNGNALKMLDIQSVKPGFIEQSILLGKYLLLVQADENKNEKLFLYNYTTQQTEDSLLLSSTVSFIHHSGNNIIMATTAGKWFDMEQSLLLQGKIKLLPLDASAIIPENFSPYKIQRSNNDQNIWFINADKGYCRVNLHTYAKQYFTVAEGILNTAGWVFEDAENNYWFGSTARGVQKLQQSSLIKQTEIAGNNLGFVNTVNITSDKESFLNTGDGIYVNEKKIAPFFKDNSSFIYWHDQYWRFKDFKTLVGSKGKVFELDKLIPNYNTDEFLFSHSSIDKEGRLVIAGRIFIFIDDKLNLTYYRPGYFCDNILETAANEYLCFLRSNEIIKIQWKGDSLQKIYSKIIPDLAPRFLMQWDSITFFAGTRLNGIKIFKWINHDLQLTGTINKLNGLSNNFINVLLKKDNRHLLAGTGTGLDAITFSGTDTIVENISQRNNLYVPFADMVQLFDSSVLCRTLDGQLFKLTNTVNPATHYMPAAFFKTIKVENDSIDFDKQNIFDHNKTNFIFSVSSPVFFDNRRILFHFVLNGNGLQWEQNTNDEDFEIKNLTPGNYVLAVTIQYPGKIYPDKHLTYSFTINPPFWKRWWFIALMIIFIGALLVFAVQQFYRRRLQKQIAGLEKQQAVEKERTRIATDMHDDFGANLSRIKFISEKIQVLHRTDDDLKNDLTKISAYSDEMAEKMNEIVWALNQRYDSLDDLVSFSRAYAADYLQDKNIELKFSTDNISNKKIHGEVRRNIFMVIKEALHNITKHAGATSVTITFKDQSILEVRIHDNGKGIDMDHIRPFANGLENMKKRIESIGGQIRIFNENGTVIMVQAPI